MSRWADLVAAEPEFAARVQAVFDAHRHKTLATVRRDGSPRISGIELQFSDGEVTMGMMPGSVKAADLRRDPRLAVHSASEDPDDENPSTWRGDAKIAGTAAWLPDSEPPEMPAHRVRIDVNAVVLIRVGSSNDHLVIESWHPGRGLVSKKRY
jgi:hypothetical protein